MVGKFATTSAAALAMAASLMASDGFAQTTTRAPSATTTAPSASAGSSSTQAVERMKPDQMRASKIIGSNVSGPDDKKIGEVSDLILDHDGKVTEVVLSVGGFLGIGDKHVAVRMSDIKMGPNDRLAVNMTKDQLTRAPRYEYADRDTSRAGTSGSSTAPALPGTGTSAPSGTTTTK